MKDPAKANELISRCFREVGRKLEDSDLTVVDLATMIEGLVTIELMLRGQRLEITPVPVLRCRRRTRP